tara:strand:+ start:804 stop:1907 length:1104 start_codon:yes stop_codon:yes gene_type:complete
MTLADATLNLYIYTGAFGNRPLNPQYTLTKKVSSPEQLLVFEISELVKDYIDVEFNGDYQSIKQNAWIEYDVSRVFSDGTTDVKSHKAIGLLGYGDFEDGINPELSNDVLISNDVIFIKSGEQAYIPIYTSVNSDGIFKVEYFNGNTLLDSISYGGSVTRFTIDTEEIRVSENKAPFTTDLMSTREGGSQGFSQQSTVAQFSTKFKLTRQDGTTRDIEIREIEECKQTPYKMSFMNKFGAIQDLWFFKRRDDSFQIQREDYKRSILKTNSTAQSEGIRYNSFDHSRKALDIRATKSLKLNTGYITEDHNEVIRQLMVTEYCWIHEEGEVRPVVPKTQSFNIKTQLNEKLINFTIEFEYANNYIQDIR